MIQNQLKNEKSLYLKNNSSNQINWIPYNLETLEHALKSQNPVMISIGESFSRWAVMMDTQAFQDTETIQFLNDNFICFKIDRNEYPNLYQYFQKATHIFNNPIYNPEIPLTVFLNNNLKPFYVGGLYPAARFENSPALIEVLKEIKNVYLENSRNIQENIIQTEELLIAPHDIKDKIKYQGNFPQPELILEAIANFKDNKNGGYGNNPKFPTFAFYQWSIEQILEGMIQKENAEFIIKSIEQIIMGGLVDHMRGGAFEYTIDEKWQIPNFVKKLSTQASYISMLAKFSLLYPSPLVYDSLIDTMKYLKEEMLFVNDEEKQDTYFFSKQDSISENFEGLYYTFTFEEFEDAINKFDDESETLSSKLSEFTKWFSLSEEGNYQNKLNVINFNPAFKQFFYEQDNWSIVRQIKKAVEKERKNRIPPKTDPQGIASWNFKLITSLVDVIQFVKIDVIKKMASDLINVSLQGVSDSFITQTQNGLSMRHTTTNSQELFLFEDMVAFAEMQIRLFEISSNKIFKQNFLDLMKIIKEEFYYDNKINTIGKSNSFFPDHFRIEADFQDKELVSSAATFVILLKKHAALVGTEEFINNLSGVIERLKQIILTNPIASGEGLRSVTYPDEAYRKISVPNEWIQKAEFQEMLQYFLHRFVIDYHENNNQSWSITSLRGVELEGKSFEDFSSSLRP